MAFSWVKKSRRAVSPVVDSAKAFEKVQLTVVWQRTMYFDFSQGVLSVLCGFFAQEKRLSFEEGTSEPIRGCLTKWCYCSRTVRQETTTQFSNASRRKQKRVCWRCNSDLRGQSEESVIRSKDVVSTLKKELSGARLGRGRKRKHNEDGSF